jgi:hypothetical protein
MNLRAKEQQISELLPRAPFGKGGISGEFILAATLPFRFRPGLGKNQNPDFWVGGDFLKPSRNASMVRSSRAWQYYLLFDI